MSNTDKSKAAPASGATTPPVPAPTKPSATNGTPVSAGNGAESAPASSVGASPDEGDERGKIQYFVIAGKVRTFPDVREAEKFLNSPDAPQCTVVYGKVSLVNEWHIATGEVYPFPSLVKAQKFLKEFPALVGSVMVRGRITVPEIRVSLRG